MIALTEIKKSDFKKSFPERKRDSHKGQNGRVLIVGGSIDYYGAPILSGMGALYGGADLVFILVPECNFDVSRSFYPDLIIRKFPGEYFDSRGVDLLLDLAEQTRTDCLNIGTGMGERPETQSAIKQVIHKIKIPLILDAAAVSALPKDRVRYNHRILITPHAGEFANLIQHQFPSLFIEKVELVKKHAQELNVNILVKNPIDIICSSKGEVRINQTGNPGMTVGGTGDVLSGLAASFAAQGLSLFEAAEFASFVSGTAGDNLQKQKGYGFTATDLAMEIPFAMKELLS